MSLISYHVRGASNLKAYDFILENLECKVSDSGTAKAHVTEILYVKKLLANAEDAEHTINSATDI